jgi:phospholipid/cholesterol/gamma-HCH transport system substrate-binding protein
MENRASYFLVGLFVLFLLTGGFIATLWLARTQDRDTSTTYYVYVRGNVTGLQAGSPVRLRGVPVGQVTDISIDRDNIELIQLTLAIRWGTPVKTDTVATLGLQGITGQSFVQLAGGTQSAADLEPRPGRRFAVIPYRPGALERLLDESPELLMQVNNVAARISQVLSDENVARIATILANIEQFSEGLGNAGGRVNSLVTQAEGAMTNFRETATDASALARDLRVLLQRLGARDGLVGNAERGLVDLRAALQSLERFSAQLDVIAAENRRPLRDFTTYSLQEMAQLMVEARALVQVLSRIAYQVERDPSRFLFGDQQRGFQPR